MLAEAGVSVVNPPLVAELSAIVAGALAGALFARRRGLDILGILGIAVASGLGGGIIRDVLLGKIPLALKDPKYLATVAAATLVGALFGSMVARLEWLLIGIDTLALGMFTCIGVQRALGLDLPIVSAVFLGSVTGIGGSLVRDVLVGELPPEALRRGAPYASLALLGAIAYVALARETQLHRLNIEAIVIVFVAGIRFVALWRGWTTPEPADVAARLRRRLRTASRR